MKNTKTIFTALTILFSVSTMSLAADVTPTGTDLINNKVQSDIQSAQAAAEVTTPVAPVSAPKVLGGSGTTTPDYIEFCTTPICSEHFKFDNNSKNFKECRKMCTTMFKKLSSKKK